jgi:2-polyprenyl-3-methyl-5-hydroxy-6-metoxy-1,4-benzoquinol methylase
MPTGVLLVAERAVTFAGTVNPPPRKILDVGCGYGKYGVLLREYVEGHPSVDGVEAWEPYVEPHKLRGIYDNLYVEDVCGLSQEILDQYDMVVMGDVIEHIGKHQALELLSRIKGWVVIATPFDHFHTDEGLPPTEAHISHWTTEDWINTGRLDLHEVFQGSHVVRLLPQQ